MTILENVKKIINPNAIIDKINHLDNMTKYSNMKKTGIYDIIFISKPEDKTN